MAILGYFIIILGFVFSLCMINVHLGLLVGSIIVTIMSARGLHNNETSLLNYILDYVEEVVINHFFE